MRENIIMLNLPEILNALKSYSGSSTQKYPLTENGLPLLNETELLELIAILTQPADLVIPVGLLDEMLGLDSQFLYSQFYTSIMQRLINEPVADALVYLDVILSRLTEAQNKANLLFHVYMDISETDYLSELKIELTNRYAEFFQNDDDSN